MSEKILIKHRYSGAVFFEHQPTADQQASGIAMRAALEAATKDGAYLVGADLVGANLVGAYLGDKKLIGKRPILMIGPIGSRSDYFTAYMTDAGVYLRTGCFFGSVDKFRAALKGERGDSEHAHEYAAALELIACHARLWAQEVEAADVAAEGAA